ncbi:hypothetical protein HMPREF9370_1976 [Neisseria wadsworthii 9715]|uniref:Uncharacterized protein n=1 Tax=Neisseria wadsworthii 9715 TaxID=1030841 RepID=G4CSB6_9NEIS|nr:hypothetical protein HMPREF9370_1976 [Neisseria wadsworthii 9715]
MNNTCLKAFQTGIINVEIEISYKTNCFSNITNNTGFICDQIENLLKQHNQHERHSNNTQP